MRLPIIGLLGAMLLVGCQPRPSSVDNAWIRLSAVQGRPAAAYFALDPGQESRILLSVKTPIAIRSELHESMAMAGGPSTSSGGTVMSMKPFAQLPIPAGERVTFAPGGKHVMLFDVAPSVKPGDTAKLVFIFADGATLEADAKVLAAGDPAP